MTRRIFIGSAILLRTQTPVKKLHGGFTFTEGPVCHRNGDLYFSDVGEERIYCLSKAGLRVVRNSSNLANGLAFDSHDRLVICERGRLTRTEPDGRFVIIADSFEGKGLHWPNDVVIRKNGSIVFSDLKQKDEWANPAKTGFNAVYQWTPKEGLVVFARDCQAPNGVALSYSEDRVFVCDTAERCVRVYERDRPGRSFVSTSKSGAPDGLKSDRSGKVWVCEEEGVKVYSPQGDYLTTLQIPESPSNCAFSHDGRRLYVTAKTSVYELDVTALLAIPKE